jgi:hypothetical protein
MFYLLRRREHRHAFGQRQKDVRGPQGQGQSGTFLLSLDQTLSDERGNARANVFVGGCVRGFVCLCLCVCPFVFLCLCLCVFLCLCLSVYKPERAEC